MEKNQRFARASRALFIVSLILGLVMIVLSALAIVLSAFKNRQAESSLELRPVEDDPPAQRPNLHLIESTGESIRAKRR